MTLENIVQVHYTPQEYKMAFDIFEHLDPFNKHILDSYIRIMEHHETPNIRLKAKHQFESNLEALRSYIGNDLYKMYGNLYLNVK